jgi:type II secretory pathway component PulF
VLLIVVLIAALIMASYKIIPAFAEVLPVDQWQGAAAFIAGLTAAIRDQGMYIFGTLVVFILIVSFSLPRWTGRTRMLVEKVTPWSIYRMWQGSSLLLAVAALMASGVKIDDNALKRLSNRASPYLKERINAIARQLTAGYNLGEAMGRTGHSFPEEELIDDLRIYATLKGFENNLSSITRDWVLEVEGKVVAAMKILNTVALVLIAVTMGLLISSIFGVVQQIQDSANNPH